MLNKKQIITIYQDDREKAPWTEDYLGAGFKIIRKRLKTGDYTIRGMEKIVCIEKKSNWAEMVLNVSSKTYRQNFILQLRRMRHFPVRFLVVHGDISKISSTKVFGNTSPTILYGWMLNITLEYGVSLLPVGSRTRARPIVRELFVRLNEFNRNGRLYYGKTD